MLTAMEVSSINNKSTHQGTFVAVCVCRCGVCVCVCVCVCLCDLDREGSKAFGSTVVVQ